MSLRPLRSAAPSLLCLLAATTGLHAQGVPPAADTTWANDPPSLESLVGFARQESGLRTAVDAFDEAHDALLEELEGSPATAAEDARRAWYRTWLGELAPLDFDALGVEGKVDYVLLRHRLEVELEMLDRGIDLRSRGGGPVGREVLEGHLLREMIPYTPEEILAIADREWAWMAEARLDASRRMGHGDDWEAALEEVKRSAVPPGGKAGVVRDLLHQSLEHMDARGSITVPPLMREVWRMAMKSAERQVGGAFFGGGIQISVSYGTEEQTHDRKLMSMRGNNPHFSRATVHHELMPGHGLQQFMTARFNPHRSAFSTPFWGEGWALYHEFVLWDQGFPRGPEDELGMLFWRMHRAARIKWIVSYHLGLMTPEEGVEYLVRDLGFERANAEAEVGWGMRAEPLYQAAYMLGGLQFQALRRELVDSGRMTERQFHDTVILGGRIPVAAVRLRLTGEGLARDHAPAWRFYGDPLGEGVGAPAPATSAARRLGGDPPPAGAAAPLPVAGASRPGGVPSVQALVAAAAGESDLRVATLRYREDLENLRQRYDVPYSPVRLDRERDFLEGWLAAVDALDPARLNAAGGREYADFRAALAEERAELERRADRAEAWAPILPFARAIQRLQERRRDHLDVDAEASAGELYGARTEIERLSAAFRAAAATRGPDGLAPPPPGLEGVSVELAARAVEHLATLQENLDSWYDFYYLFDPLFTWWMRVPYERTTGALSAYGEALGAWARAAGADSP